MPIAASPEPGTAVTAASMFDCVNPMPNPSDAIEIKSSIRSSRVSLVSIEKVSMPPMNAPPAPVRVFVAEFQIACELAGLMVKTLCAQFTATSWYAEPVHG